MLHKAPYQADDDSLKAGREAAFECLDRDLYLDFGFFISRFAHTELALTLTLALSIKTNDLDGFDLLCRGMDARTKIERLRKSAKRHGGIGPNLAARLNKFEKHAIPLRNQIAHSSPTHSEDDRPMEYYLSGLSSLPWRELENITPLGGTPPERIRSLDLYAWGLWLTFFTKDIASVQPLAHAQKQLEIETPHSRLQ